MTTASKASPELRPGPGLPSSPTSADRRQATLGLLAVALAIVVFHVLLTDLGRPINWDEAVHVTQVNPARPAVFMEPHRTRGVSLLVAPIAVFDPSMLILRVYLLLLGAAGTFVAFRTWIATIGWAAPVAAALYSAFWVTIFYSVEVLPNHASALFTIAAAGLVARYTAGGELRYRGWELAAIFAALALIRPPDGVALGLGLAAMLLMARGRHAVPAIVRAAAGGLVGMAPWLLEGMIRFGLLPTQVAESAGEYSVQGEVVNKLPLYLMYLDDRLRCANTCLESYVEGGGGWGLPSAPTTLWLVVTVALTVLGLVVAGRHARVIAVPLVATLPVLAFYGFTGGAMNMRYILPAIGLAVVPVAVGLVSLWWLLPRWWSQHGEWGRVALVVVLVATAWWQSDLALERMERPGTRDRAAELGAALREVADGEDCVVATPVNYPQLQYWSGCLAVEASKDPGVLQPPLGELGSYVDLAAHGERGARVFAVGPEDPSQDSMFAQWREAREGADPISGFRLYEHQPGAPLPPPPCPPEDGPTLTLAEVLAPDC